MGELKRSAETMIVKLAAVIKISICGYCGKIDWASCDGLVA